MSRPGFDPDIEGLWRESALAASEDAGELTARDPEVIGWLHTVEALAQGCIFTARYRAAASYARTVMRAHGYPNLAVGTLFLALARLEDEDGFFAAARDAGEGAEDLPWFLLGRTILLYKLGQRRSARRALRDFAARCDGGAFFLINPTYHDPYLPVRPAALEAWDLSHQAVWEADGIIEGRNAVTEALRAGTPIDKIYLARGETDAALGHIASTARSKGVVVVECDRRKLDGMSRTHSHQGVIALAAVREYASVDGILETARAKGEPPLIVVCDELSDPHNLGAVIRTAECAGAHGVIIPKRRSAGLTAVVAKTSAGAVSHVPVARVANLPALLKELKEAGVWVFGTAADGDRLLYDADLKGPAAIVIGSEGDGMGRLVAETCDFKVRIPMRGKLNSLNASAAAAILLYEAVRQRME